MQVKTAKSGALAEHQKPKKIRLFPADSLGQRLCEIFSHGWQFIFASLPEPGQKPEWQTETRYPLEPRNLWSRWQNPNHLLGVRFGRETVYGMIDIDARSPYHFNQDEAALEQILAALEAIGICRTLMVRSSDSGGLHIYLPLEQPVLSYGLAMAVQGALEQAGFRIAPGQLELFPNSKAYKKNDVTNYNAHRLPLQPGSGSCLLNRFGEEIGDRLEQFLDIWEMAANGNDLEQLQEAIATAKQRSNAKSFSKRSNRAEQWRLDDLAIIQPGWTGAGQTNEILKVIARYGVVWEALSGDALVDYVEQTAVNLPGYREFCNHQHEIRRRAQEWAREAEKYYSPYCSFPKRTGNFHQHECSQEPQENVENNVVPFNQQKADDALERLQQAIANLEQKDTPLPAGIDARAKLLTSQAGCSRRTLYKHRKLWHPRHTPSKQDGTTEPESVSADLIVIAQEDSKQPLTPLSKGSENSVPTSDKRRWGMKNWFFFDWIISLLCQPTPRPLVGDRCPEGVDNDTLGDGDRSCSENDCSNKDSSHEEQVVGENLEPALTQIFTHGLSPP
jgi:hypothetical protein